MPGLRAETLSFLFQFAEGSGGFRRKLEEICSSASEAVQAGKTILILSDREVSSEKAALPSLLSTGAVHHHLIREGLRTRCGIILETGEVREIHHTCFFPPKAPATWKADTPHPNAS
jgi:hypothetical protein